jgi:outer membrane murein-binding lipoprotein Lpp
MMQTAALIAAISFAVLALAGVAALLSMARFTSRATRLLARGDTLLDRAQATVDKADAAADRAGRQLDLAESVAASMDELGTGVAELAGQVTALAGFGKAIAAGPVGKAGAVAYGVRYALGRRRARALPGSVLNRSVER